MIPRRLVRNYAYALQKLSNGAQAALLASVQGIDLTNIADARNEIIKAMDVCLDPATDAAAVIGAAFYDGIREIEIGEQSGIIAEPERNREATEESVKAFMKIIVDGGTREQLIVRLAERVDYEVKVAANLAVMNCGERDGRG